MIKKGDKFRCIKTVVMDNNPNDIDYYQGLIYTSENDNCITDESGCKYHYWDRHSLWKEYFERLSNNPSKFINTDLEQAKSLQSIAFNNILAKIESEQPTLLEIGFSIGIDNIQDTLCYRYSSYRKIIDKISINYEILLNNNIYIIKVSLTNGHITIYKK